jgi:hypothetical protein
MRKIEKEMLTAIKDGKTWHSGNTSVFTHGSLGWCASVYLHGNKIAETAACEAFPIVTTFRQYPTRTTVSRLRALGINASIKNGAPMIDGEPV